MRKISLVFLLIGFFCLLNANIEIATISPWSEFRRIIYGFLTPNFGYLIEVCPSIINTIAFAFCGVFLGIIFGIPLAFYFEHPWVRYFCSSIRSIHEIFWAFLLLPIFGLNSITGILAIGIPYAGIFGKVYAEILQESDRSPLLYLPYQFSLLPYFFYFTLPNIFHSIKIYTSYRFECALRSSAVLGFIGLETLGNELETAFSEGHYSQVSILLYAFFLIVGTKQYWLKPKAIGIYILSAFVLILSTSKIHFSLTNIKRFFFHEIVPYPIRNNLDVIDSAPDIIHILYKLYLWFEDIFVFEAWEGIVKTLILTQIVLVASGIFAMITFPLASKWFHGKWVRYFQKFWFVLLRTTPEYLLAYFFLQLFGSSMLPAILAIALHNGAILAYFSYRQADLLQIRFDAPDKKVFLYFFEVLPRIYGQFLAFLFYRWEVMMRETAILGIIGIYTLGNFIDSAKSDDKLDKMLVLILITGLLNLFIDSISQRIRTRFQITDKMVSIE